MVRPSVCCYVYMFLYLGVLLPDDGGARRPSAAVWLDNAPWLPPPFFSGWGAGRGGEGEPSSRSSAYGLAWPGLVRAGRQRLLAAGERGGGGSVRQHRRKRHIPCPPPPTLSGFRDGTDTRRERAVTWTRSVPHAPPYPAAVSKWRSTTPPPPPSPPYQVECIAKRHTEYRQAGREPAD